MPHSCHPTPCPGTCQTSTSPSLLPTYCAQPTGAAGLRPATLAICANGWEALNGAWLLCFQKGPCVSRAWIPAAQGRDRFEIQICQVKFMLSYVKYAKVFFVWGGEELGLIFPLCFSFLFLGLCLLLMNIPVHRMCVFGCLSVWKTVIPSSHRFQVKEVLGIRFCWSLHFPKNVIIPECSYLKLVYTHMLKRDIGLNILYIDLQYAYILKNTDNIHCDGPRKMNHI